MMYLFDEINMLVIKLTLLNPSSLKCINPSDSIYNNNNSNNNNNNNNNNSSI